MLVCVGVLTKADAVSKSPFTELELFLEIWISLFCVPESTTVVGNKKKLIYTILRLKVVGRH